MLECFAWREDGSQIAIAWMGDDGLAEVDTELDRRLTGVDPAAEPWATVRRTGVAVAGEVRELPAPWAGIAADLGLVTFWITAVNDPGGRTPVTVTAFGSSPSFPVDALHSAGMEVADRYIQVILGWSDHVARLETAAHHDPLTGLANRRRLLEAIDANDRPGAMLYCDLDGFKPVNDRWGHGVGDEVLVSVGERLASLVRHGDLVSRMGGDEFAVVLWDADLAEAEQIAERIRELGALPIRVSAGELLVGISVGVAASEDPLHQEVVARADTALYADKDAGRRRRPGG